MNKSPFQFLAVIKSSTMSRMLRFVKATFKVGPSSPAARHQKHLPVVESRPQIDCLFVASFPLGVSPLAIYFRFFSATIVVASSWTRAYDLGPGRCVFLEARLTPCLLYIDWGLPTKVE